MVLFSTKCDFTKATDPPRPSSPHFGNWRFHHFLRMSTLCKLRWWSKSSSSEECQRCAAKAECFLASLTCSSNITTPGKTSLSGRWEDILAVCICVTDVLFRAGCHEQMVSIWHFPFCTQMEIGHSRWYISIIKSFLVLHSCLWVIWNTVFSSAPHLDHICCR